MKTKPTVLTHYRKVRRSFPANVDVWLPEGAIVVGVEANDGSGAWIVSYLEPSGRKSKTG